MADPVYLTDTQAATYGIPAGDAGSRVLADAQAIYEFVQANPLATQAAISTAMSAWNDPDRINAAVALLVRMGRLLGPL